MNDDLVSLVSLGVADPLQLPDWVFGERSLCEIEVILGASGSGAVMSAVTLPERIVVWDFFYRHSYTSAAGDYVRFGLLDHLPATEAAFLMCAPLFPEFGVVGPQPRIVYSGAYPVPWHLEVRQLVETGRRRFGFWYLSNGGLNAFFTAAIVYSWVPRAVPVWVAKHLGLME